VKVASRFVRKTILATLALCLAVCGNAQQPNVPPGSMFPVAVGAYWIYEGDVTYQLTANETTTATLRRRMEVKQLAAGPSYRAALLKGGPWDFVSYSNNKSSGDYLLVSTRDATYFAEGKQALDLFAEIKRSGLTHEVRDTLADDIWFRTPIRANGTYCASDQVGREDRMYCWAVMDVNIKPVSGIVGVRPRSRPVYQLAFRTNPDHQVVEIVPGVGMVSFTYSHHGTPLQVDVRLIEYHAGK